jgi:hypothetical protein
VYEAECIDIDAENKLITIIGKSIREGKIIGKSSNMYLKT